MKFGVFVVLAALVFFCVVRGSSAPLAYFSFFPLGLLILFYFIDLGHWVLVGLGSVLLVGVYFRVNPAPFAAEGAMLGGITVAVLGFLAYYRRVWRELEKEDETRREQAEKELKDLKERHATRIESLLHLEKQVASLINLFEIARDFNECLDIKETAQILFKKVLPELAFESAQLILLEPDKTPPRINRGYLISAQGVEERAATVYDEAEKEWIKQALKEKRFVSLEGVWLFPLILEGEFNALLAIKGSAKEDLAKFEVLASQLTLQVRKVRLYEMVRELSIIDGLTGVFVRRHFLERFEEEIRRTLRHNFPMCVLMLDIDHFKRYNDDFGHLVGDATLREVAQVIRANVRNVDIVARYGGEEFVVVIPETKEEGGMEVAERIRSAVARRSFRVYDEETKATVSIGISTFPRDIEGSVGLEFDAKFLFELLQKADRALYRAKEEGRNRVVAYGSLKEGKRL